MNLLFSYIITFHFYFKIISTSFLNQDEMRMSMELIKQLKIRQCILVGDAENEDVFSEAKEFSSAKIPITYLTYNPLATMVYYTEFVYFHTGLIFKEENLEILELISKFFKNASHLIKQLPA